MIKILSIALIFFCELSIAQKVGITEIPIEGNTSISIQKGAGQTSSTEMSQILDGSAEVTGEPNVLAKGARDSWKKACDEWKQEVKELNKDNQVIAMNCNSPNCSGSNGSTSCKSVATYKVKVNLKK